jgi:hypothetical protein
MKCVAGSIEDRPELASAPGFASLAGPSLARPSHFRQTPGAEGDPRCARIERRRSSSSRGPRGTFSAAWAALSMARRSPRRRKSPVRPSAPVRAADFDPHRPDARFVGLLARARCDPGVGERGPGERSDAGPMRVSGARSDWASEALASEAMPGPMRAPGLNLGVGLNKPPGRGTPTACYSEPFGNIPGNRGHGRARQPTASRSV